MKEAKGILNHEAFEIPKHGSYCIDMIRKAMLRDDT